MYEQNEDNKKIKKVKTKKVISKEKRDSGFLFIILGAVLFLIVGVVYMLLFTEIFNFEKKNELYLTMVLDAEGKKGNIYRLDLDRFEMEPVFDEGDNFGGSFSTDGQQMVFVRAYGDSSQILIYKEETAEVTEITSKMDGFLRDPKFSPDGNNIVFWSVENDTPVIYMSNLEGEVEKLTEGFRPLFSKDGKYLLFLQEQGLYTFNLKDSTQKWVFKFEDFEENSWDSLTLALSSKNNIIISNTSLLKKYILEFDNLKNFVIEGALYLDSNFLTTPHSWAQYSPNGSSFVNIEEMSEVEEGQFKYMLVFYNKEDFSIGEVYEFEDYILNLEDSVVEEVWVTDWVIR